MMGTLILLLPPLLLWPLPLVAQSALLSAPWSEGATHIWSYWAAQQAGSIDIDSDLLRYPLGQSLNLVDPLHLIPYALGDVLGGPALGFNFVLCFGLMVSGIAGWMLARVTDADASGSGPWRLCWAVLSWFIGHRCGWNHGRVGCGLGGHSVGHPVESSSPTERPIGDGFGFGGSGLCLVGCIQCGVDGAGRCPPFWFWVWFQQNERRKGLKWGLAGVLGAMVLSWPYLIASDPD